MPSILFVGEDHLFYDDLEEQVKLNASDFVITYVQTIHEVLEVLSYSGCDLLLIDSEVEELPGVELLKSLRKKNIRIPAFLFAQKSQDVRDENIVGLNHVIYKPFSLEEFLDKLKSSLVLYENSAEGVIEFDKFELYQSTKELKNIKTGDIVKLTEKEIAILKYLYKSGGAIVSRQELLNQVWGYNPEVTTHTLETHIYRLRQKLEEDTSMAKTLITDEGGYLLVI
jgi:DNA-binding response OmpR family regulator